MHRLVLILSLCAVGCGDRVIPGDTTGDAGSDSETGGGTSGGTSGTSGPGSASGAGSGPVTTTTTATTTTTTAGSDTGTDPDLKEACLAVCDKFLECYPDEGTLDQCLADCIDGSPGQECAAEWAALYYCYAEQTCIDIENGEVCIEEEAAISEACWGGGTGGEVCSVGVGGNEEGTECSMTEYCPESVRDVTCTETGCVCTENGQIVAECPADGVCANDWIGLEDQFYGCCGFG